MKFDVVGLNRIVELDDEIVAEYCRYKPLSEDPFVIVAISEYGHEPTAQEVSDEELSKLCNEVLLSDLKALALLPNALAFVDKIDRTSAECCWKGGFAYAYDMGRNSEGVPQTVCSSGRCLP